MIIRGRSNKTKKNVPNKSFPQNQLDFNRKLGWGTMGHHFPKVKAYLPLLRCFTALPSLWVCSRTAMAMQRKMQASWTTPRSTWKSHRPSTLRLEDVQRSPSLNIEGGSEDPMTGFSSAMQKTHIPSCRETVAAKLLPTGILCAYIGFKWQNG